MDKELLQILRCPVSGWVLHYDSATAELVSAEAALAYPVRDGIPVLLADEARKLTPQECEKYGTAGSGASHD